MQADWDLQGLCDALQSDFAVTVDPKAWLAAEPELEEAVLRERIVAAVHEAYDAKVARTGAPMMRQIEKQVMLQKVDHHWREHLAAMDYLRQGIHLRGYAQKDPSSSSSARRSSCSPPCSTASSSRPPP